MSRAATGPGGSVAGDAARVLLECGVCWWVYDPSRGDDLRQIPAGTPFGDLPPDWRCPHCDAPSRQFLVLREAAGTERRRRPDRPAGAIERERRLARLLAAYERVSARMRKLPVHNRKLRIEAVGFRRWGEGLLGVLVTPWCMNLVVLPDEDGEPRLEGSTRELELPSGRYEFVAGFLEEVGTVESCSLFSPMESFDDPDVARLVAEHAIDAALREPPPAAPETLTRRGFLTPGRKAGST